MPAGKSILAGVIDAMQHEAERIIAATVADCPMGEPLTPLQLVALKAAIYWAIGYSNNLMLKTPPGRQGGLRHALAVLATKKLQDLDGEAPKPAGHYKTIDAPKDAAGHE